MNPPLHFRLIVPLTVLLTRLYVDHGAKPFEFDALLLFALPSVLTLQKFVELLEFGERSHHQDSPDNLV